MHSFFEDPLAMSLELGSAERNGTVSYDPRCVPYFSDHKYRCLPHFLIAGVPKAGTTSLYKYLLQHPHVLAAEDKELTFWGNFFSPKRRPSRDKVVLEKTCFGLFLNVAHPFLPYLTNEFLR
tara:strand:- start:1651 stop:2016 length:366 start_codon:yes stop_codon:yes gene_type:complete